MIGKHQTQILQVAMSEQETVFVTGAAGFIGSHTCVALVDAGYRVHGIDNFSNSSREVATMLQKMCGSQIAIDECDIRDARRLSQIMHESRPSGVVHFAGKKSVPDSVREPLCYYDNNVRGTLSLLEVMEKAGVRRIIFSSSAMVYGQGVPPFSEESPTDPVNPYGATKLHVERMLADLAQSDHRWTSTALRYFNPIGAHASGLLGEDLNTGSQNVMPALLRVAIGRLPIFTLFGDDYSTPDGTSLRDYIHVMDLAEAHVLALRRPSQPQAAVINLGTGNPISVLEMLSTFRKVTGLEIPVRVVERRSGDVSTLYALVGRAADLLGWTAFRSLEDMCRDAWTFAQKQYLDQR